MAQTITLRSDDDTAFTAYVARPTVPVTGAVIVIHEIWGLVDHITGIADRFAAEGYLAVAPDLLSRIGIAADIGLELQEVMFSPDEAVRSDGQPRLREAMAPMQAPEFSRSAIESLVKTVDWLSQQDEVAGRIAVVGYCFGGSYAFELAAADRRVRAVVPFYGAGPDDASVSAITAPILAFYGAEDSRLMDTLPALTEQMAAAGVRFEPKVYDGVGHAFFNDSNPRTYDAASAADAWTRALSFIAAESAASQIRLRR